LYRRLHFFLQVLQYYYRGVASWDWFYPYHYAPMAQDMRRLDNIDGEHIQRQPTSYYACWLAARHCVWDK
jgi:5'-3' exonuclease